MTVRVRTACERPESDIETGSQGGFYHKDKFNVLTDRRSVRRRRFYLMEAQEGQDYL